MNKDNRYRGIHICEEDDEIFNYLKAVEPFAKLTSAQLFALALIFGKKEGKRKPLDGKKVDIIVPGNIDESIHSLMKAISFEETGSLEVLDNIDEYFTICEEYAKVGFTLLDTEYSENPDSFLENLELEALEYIENTL